MTSQAKSSRLVATGAAVVVFVAVGLGVLAVPAWAVARSTIEISQAGSPTLLGGGASQTTFGLRVPDGARCAGDSAHQGYREWSYLVPKGTDLATISFVGPVPQPGLGFDAAGEFFGPAFTEPITGAVRLAPAFSFARWTTADLLPRGATTSVWEGGIACSTSKGAMSGYWNAEFTFTSTPSDPLGFTWTVKEPVHHSTSGSQSWPKVLVAVVIVVAAALGARALWPRSHRRNGEAQDEDDRTASTGTHR
jgi:hypothetical protein